MNEKRATLSKIVYADRPQLPEGNAYIVADGNVARLYPFVAERADFIMPPGEDSKSLKTVEAISLDMVRKGCDRSARLIAIGGGVAGDLGGFTAACYMRGIRWTVVPTTLLAQVDASIGGKTAVDLAGYKNIVGAFHLPDEVIVSPMWLGTLPDREKRCGEGEIFKTALLSERVRELYAPGKIDGGLIRACIEFKTEVVEKDFTESGLRKILNVGHTLGHALEREDGHARSHGEYVAMGIALESFLFRDRIDGAFYEYVQENSARISPVVPFDPAAIAGTATADKKNRDGRISFIVTENVGRWSEVSLDAAEVERRLSAWK